MALADDGQSCGVGTTQRPVALAGAVYSVGASAIGTSEDLFITPFYGIMARYSGASAGDDGEFTKIGTLLVASILHRIRALFSSSSTGQHAEGAGKGIVAAGAASSDEIVVAMTVMFSCTIRRG